MPAKTEAKLKNEPKEMNQEINQENQPEAKAVSPVFNLNLDSKKYFEAVGRRKTSVARVRIWLVPEKSRSSETDFQVNQESYLKYFKTLEFQKIVDAPLRKLRLMGIFKVLAKVQGGGIRGQAEAIRHGLARVLAGLDPEWHKRLKRSGFLTRDPRMVERKKYGKKKARKSPRWHKR